MNALEGDYTLQQVWSTCPTCPSSIAKPLVKPFVGKLRMLHGSSLVWVLVPFWSQFPRVTSRLAHIIHLLV